MTVEPVTEGQARIARQAYSEFGKGEGHPAKLNFGNCSAYAGHPFSIWFRCQYLIDLWESEQTLWKVWSE